MGSFVSIFASKLTLPLTDHQKAVRFATLLPCSAILASCVSLVVVSYYDRDYAMECVEWSKSLKRPSWACTYSPTTLLQLLKLVPLGYATVQVWVKGGGFDGLFNRAALTTYAIFHGFHLLGLTTHLNKSLKMASYGSFAAFFHSCAMCYLYYKVDKNAGYIVIPYILSAAYGCILYRSMWNLNQNK